MLVYSSAGWCQKMYAKAGLERPLALWLAASAVGFSDLLELFAAVHPHRKPMALMQRGYMQLVNKSLNPVLEALLLMCLMSFVEPVENVKKSQLVVLGVAWT